MVPVPTHRRLRARSLIARLDVLAQRDVVLWEGDGALVLWVGDQSDWSVVITGADEWLVAGRIT